MLLNSRKKGAAVRQLGIRERAAVLQKVTERRSQGLEA